jgi:hypothetical protein
MKQFLLLLAVLFPFMALAQMDTVKWNVPAPDHYSFIHYDENTIAHRTELDSIFMKLVALHATHKGRVNIVHIGDSHLQADGITSVLRNGFQAYFGNAGRGLVFPYPLANTNGPKDLHASSNATWHSNRITNNSSPIETGICGYGMVSANKEATVNVWLKDENGNPEYFNRMVFFLGKQKEDYLLTDSSKSNPISLSTLEDANSPSLVYESDALLSGCALTKTTFGDYQFYGVSLERKDTGGVVYHTIGANGARYDQWASSNLFWQQVKALNGDLFILSMGTNEAQNPDLSEQAMAALYDSMIHKIHQVAPGAPILITTPAGSYYKGKRPNAVLTKVTNGLIRSAEKNGAAWWDLYNMSGGKKSPAGWKRAGLLGHDLVHYQPKGYQLQGQLLLNAFAKAYNTYAKLHPYNSEPTVHKKPAPKNIARPKVMEKADATVKPQPANENKKPTSKQDTTRTHNSKIHVKYEE